MQSLRRAETPFSHYDKRQRLRFDLSFPVLIRTTGDVWKAGVSKNVSVKGAHVLTTDSLLSGADAEWAVRLSPELTKTKQPLIIRFSGTVLRCEHVCEGDFSFRIALESRDWRYLPKEEAAIVNAMFDETPAIATK